MTRRILASRPGERPSLKQAEPGLVPGPESSGESGRSPGLVKAGHSSVDEGERSATRAEKVARARALRAEGLKLREIGERLGVATQTAHAYLDDPDLSKQRARRKRYATPCDWCGEPTDGSGGYAKQRSICQACREWPEEAILDAIRRWAEDHDGIPPREVDWHWTGDDHPSSSAVIRRLGWNNALKLAGFTPHQDKSPERQQWIVDQLRAGRSVADVARELAVTREAIYNRLATRGLTIAALREASA